MRFLLAILLITRLAVAAETEWKLHKGRFANMELPADVANINKDVLAIDSYVDVYASPRFSISFDGQDAHISRHLQKDVETAVKAWSEYRHEDWGKSIYVKDQSGKDIASIASISHEEEAGTNRYYLYFGFSNGDSSFAIHIRFGSLKYLDEIERVLKSIKIKPTKVQPKISRPSDNAIPGLEAISR